MNKLRFSRFIEHIHHALREAQNDEAAILARIEPLVADLVKHDDWLEEKYTQTHPDYYQQYCLYVCPENHFSVVSFVWGPGQHTPVHDHTVWGVIGMLRGAEIGTRYERLANGQYAPVSENRLEAGMTECVSPTIGDIHKVTNAYTDRSSISIHIYGADIGKVSRHVYIPESGEIKKFISGYAPLP